MKVAKAGILGAWPQSRNGQQFELSRVRWLNGAKDAL